MFLSLTSIKYFFHLDLIEIIHNNTNIYIYISIITKSANYYLFRIINIRKSITVYLTKSLVNSLVPSRIYYSSSILINLPLSSISHLNRVIRLSIRIPYNLRIRDNLLPHTNTYLHGSHITNSMLIAYYILFIHRYILRITPPVFLLL